MWLLIWTFVSLFTFLDLGVGSAVVSRIAAGLARGDENELRVTVASARGVLLGVAVLVLVVALPVIWLADPAALLHLHAAVGTATLRRALTVFVVCLGVGVPLSLPQRVLLGTHRADLLARLGVVGNLGQLALGGLALAGHWNVSAFVAVVMSNQLMTGTLCMLVGRRRTMRGLWFTGASWAVARQLLQSGASFLGIAVAGAIAFETDVLVLLLVRGPTAVAAYAVPARLFLMIPGLIQMALLPLWPSVAHAMAQHDRTWIASKFVAALRWCFLVGAVAAGVITLMAKPLVGLLAPTVTQPDLALIAVLFSLALVHSVSAPFAVFLSGLNLVQTQLLAAAAMAVANLAASIVLAHLIGIAGPPLATVLTQTLLVLAPLFFVIRRFVATSGGTNS